MKYWHLQMHLPEGRGGEEINPLDMLEDSTCPFIGIHKWEDKQYYDFLELKIGTIVMVRNGNNPIALCQITSDAYKDDNFKAQFFHTDYRDVKILGWAKDYPVKTAASLFSQGTFKSCSDTTSQFKYIDTWLKYIRNNEQMNDILDLLKQKNNIILQGAPGTGKTYTTAEIAMALLNSEYIGKEHSQIMNDYTKNKISIDKSPDLNASSVGRIISGQIGFVTFHQSMDYEDFIEGIKPVTKGEGISYQVENGIFKMMARVAIENPTKPYVLIIDEINRGNISKILGELITLLESDKRIGNKHPISVTLPYSKEEFSVPSNLYIIGTMNTTDRSVGSIDYAIRRRFDFVTLKSREDIVKDNSSAEALDLFRCVQKFIADNHDTDLDIEDLRIGHSYFLVTKDDDGSKLNKRWTYEILPLLREYYKDGIIDKDIPEDKREISAFKSFVNE